MNQDQEIQLTANSDILDKTEGMLDEACIDGRIFFLVHWAGRPHEDATWEPSTMTAEKSFNDDYLRMYIYAADGKINTRGSGIYESIYGKKLWVKIDPKNRDIITIVEGARKLTIDISKRFWITLPSSRQ